MTPGPGVLAGRRHLFPDGGRNPRHLVFRRREFPIHNRKTRRRVRLATALLIEGYEGPLAALLVAPLQKPAIH